MVENIQIIGLVAAFLVIEAVKFLVNKLSNQKSQLTPNEQFYLKELYQMHNVRDDSGRPIWYMPTSVGQQQDKIIDILASMSDAQKETAHILERILDKLDRLDDK